ncbi:DNA/RNA non-specific endonuclease [Nocardiopsis potens]|uniref:DNA/RNA non-specific endonuclease n=1 Tax=Nocardiopsis potens TaxID=1246458 RepID=UPI00034C7E16|nr:DNA/RNA non-specific endonuclease [Nocardiopsis potens]
METYAPDVTLQTGLDVSLATMGDLINPEAIPMPGTALEALAGSVSDIRSAAGDIADGGEDVKSSWQGLRSVYEAPEDEELFSVMDPVAAQGNALHDDLVDIADALDEFGEEAAEAKNKLKSLKILATDFVEKMSEDPHGLANPYNAAMNWTLKRMVNNAWEKFQQAERTCGNKISKLCDGPKFVPASDGEPGKGEIAYGAAAGYTPDATYDFGEFSEWIRFGRESLDLTQGYVEEVDKPWPLDWAVDTHSALWDGFTGGATWGFGVAAVSAAGMWREGKGWARSPGEMIDNALQFQKERIQGAGALVGVYGQDGWMTPFTDEWSWDKFGDNAGAAWGATATEFFALDEWEDRPAYTVVTSVGNLATFFTSFPARGGTVLTRALEMKGEGKGAGDWTVKEFWGRGEAGKSGFSLPKSFQEFKAKYAQISSDIQIRLDSVKANILFRFGRPAGAEHGIEAFGSVEERNSETPDDDFSRETESNLDSTFEGAIDPTGQKQRGVNESCENNIDAQRDEVFSGEASERRVSEAARAVIEEAERILREPQRVLVGANGMEIPDRRGGGENDIDELLISSSHGEPGAVGDGRQSNAGSQSVQQGGPSPQNSVSDLSENSQVATSLSPDLTGGGRFGAPPGGGRPGTGDGGAEGGSEPAGSPIKIDDNHPLSPDREERFGDRGGLSPNAIYQVSYKDGAHCGIFKTDSHGEIVEIETWSKSSQGATQANVELNNPRPNAKYEVDGLVFETDHLGRTVSVEGEISLRPGVRDSEAERYVKKQGEADFIEIYEKENQEILRLAKQRSGSNVSLDDVPHYMEVVWNPGHLIARQFAGPAEKINLVPMVEYLNRDIRRVDGSEATLQDSFRVAERTWVKALSNIPPDKVKVRIELSYEGDVSTPEIVDVRYTINRTQEVISYSNVPPIVKG